MPTLAEVTPGARRQPARATRWLRSLAWPGRLALAAGTAAVAIVLAVAVVFGVSDGGMRHQLDQAQASSQQIAMVMTAQDAVMMNGQVNGGGWWRMTSPVGTSASTVMLRQRRPF